VLDDAIFIVFLIFMFLTIKIIKRGLIIIAYIEKYINVAIGLIVLTRANIQPMCVIDE
jgi:hypothetical protein